MRLSPSDSSPSAQVCRKNKGPSVTWGWGAGRKQCCPPRPCEWALTRGKLALKEEQKQAKDRLGGAELAGGT